MTHEIHDVGVAKHIGSYSDAIEVEPGLRWLYTSGTAGVDESGVFPEGIEAQTRLVWKYVFAALEKARMGPSDLVKVTTTLINRDDMAAYVKIRKELLGDVKPSFMLAVVSELIRPQCLVEVEIVAAKK
ncbi:RidA family protein [Acidisphaera sp. S103]|uniref:RidA family protein n=1 Tax=Acidisphaera sp. S103 TaxID=1747223 RepID=UPI00131D83C4|nr:RidA family protein [Acidisphaera sp. S103]